MKPRRDTPGQLAFTLAGDAAAAPASAEPLAEFFAEVGRLWGLPIARVARLSLRDHALDEVAGKLLLAAAPDLPLRAAEPLRLRVGDVVFLSTQVVAWSALEPESAAPSPR